MKSLISITFLFFGLSLFAQQAATPKNRPDFSPEQRAALQTKRMTLLLDLDGKQIAQIQALQLARAKQREAKRQTRQESKARGEKPSKEELFAIKSERLDQQITYQKQLKKILTDGQYNQWKKIQKNHRKSKIACKSRRQKAQGRGKVGI